MSEILEQIERIGMIPVLSIDLCRRALPLAQALSEGGLPLMEVMFRTDAAAQSIELIAKNMPDFLVGAGTVLTIEQAQRAIDCGARFLVAPGFNPELVAFAQNKNMPIVPGCVSPSEVDAARRLGLKVLKFFPAVENGGVKAMGLLGGPFPDIRFVPTGDLTLPLAVEYLSFYRVAAAGGDFMLKYEDIRSDNYEKIKSDVENAIGAYLKLNIKEIALYEGSDPSCAQKTCALLKALKLCAKGGRPCLKTLPQDSTAPGTLGRITIDSADAHRAFYYLQRQGLSFEEKSIERNANGRISAAVLTDPFQGFALQLVQD